MNYCSILILFIELIESKFLPKSSIKLVMKLQKCSLIIKLPKNRTTYSKTVSPFHWHTYIVTLSVSSPLCYASAAQMTSCQIMCMGKTVFSCMTVLQSRKIK
jgi:hypothetical protein